MQFLLFLLLGGVLVGTCLLVGWLEGKARERAREDAEALLELQRRTVIDAQVRRVEAAEIARHGQEAALLRAAPDRPEFDEAAARDLLKGEERS